MSKKIASHFLFKVKKENSIIGFDITERDKNISTIELKEGVYLAFIDEMLLTKEESEQFCEVIYESLIVIVRKRDITNLIL